MKIPFNLSKKSFAIYGLGSTGQSVISYFDKIGFKNYVIWDDQKHLRKKWNLNKKDERLFSKLLNFVDYIILSPGINLYKAKLKKKLIRNKLKIITDLDLLYMFNPKVRSIVVTGTNGKSTTVKIIEHLLKKNRIHTCVGGNIGKPVLRLSLKKNPLLIIEASSFQLAYSKLIKPKYAIILNITNDHIDWHRSMKNYVDAKFKIFSLQAKNDFAFVNNKKLLKKYKIEKYSAKMKFVHKKNISKIKNKINNHYLNSRANEENISFAFSLSKQLKISEKSFIRSLKTFRGLPHRYEIFLRKKNKIFINDSKATSFQASRFALESNKNIFWIVGGKPKLGDKINLKKLKKNIFKSYIIGNYLRNFKNQLNREVKFKLSKTMKNAIISIFKDMKKKVDEKATILLSPASASYDQYENFEERGNQFKEMIKKYARKYL